VVSPVAEAAVSPAAAEAAATNSNGSDKQYY